MALVLDRVHPVGEGTQRIHRFDNGYGASVVRFTINGMRGSYGSENGRWELAVVKFTGDGPEDFEITYDTPITDDVLGWLDDNGVVEQLAAIEALP